MVDRSAAESASQKMTNEDELSVGDLIRVLRQRWRTVAITTIVCGMIALIIAFILPVKYEATVLLSPVSEDADSNKGAGLSSFVSQFGGLGALGSLNFGTSNRKSEAIAILESRTLTETYISEKNLLPLLFSDSWNQKEQKWKSDDPAKVPSLWKAEMLFRGIRKVDDSKRTNLITLTIKWKDAQLAADWANDLVARTNQYMRQKAIEQSNRNVIFLNEQVTRTSVVDLQRAIYELIEAEIKKAMIAQGSDEYAFKIIDPAVKSEIKSEPKRTVLLLIGLLVGIILGLLIVITPVYTRSV